MVEDKGIIVMSNNDYCDDIPYKDKFGVSDPLSITNIFNNGGFINGTIYSICSSSPIRERETDNDFRKRISDLTNDGKYHLIDSVIVQNKNKKEKPKDDSLIMKLLKRI